MKAAFILMSLAYASLSFAGIPSAKIQISFDKGIQNVSANTSYYLQGVEHPAMGEECTVSRKEKVATVNVLNETTAEIDFEELSS